MTGCEGQPGAVARVGLSHRERGQQGRTICAGYILPTVATEPAESPPRGYISGVLCILPPCHPSTRTNAGAHHTEPPPPRPRYGTQKHNTPHSPYRLVLQKQAQNFCAPYPKRRGLSVRFRVANKRARAFSVRFSGKYGCRRGIVDGLWEKLCELYE